jgi:hypothetical protein
MIVQTSTPADTVALPLRSKKRGHKEKHEHEQEQEDEAHSADGSFMRTRKFVRPRFLPRRISEVPRDYALFVKGVNVHASSASQKAPIFPLEMEGGTPLLLLVRLDLTSLSDDCRCFWA